MDTERVAPTLGIVASLALVVAYLAPYLLIPNAGGDVGTYYSAGPVGASAVPFLAAVSVIAFLSGLQQRQEPDVVAGLTLVLGLAVLGLALLWAVSMPDNYLFSFPASASWIEFHRWVVVVLAAVLPASAGLYARAVL
jgi:hypothetical protein